MTTEETTLLDQAYCGYNAGSRAYVPYSGKLTAKKEQAICNLLAQCGYVPGWKCKDVVIKQVCGGMWSYKEDGGSGLLSSVEVFHLQGDK